MGSRWMMPRNRYPIIKLVDRWEQSSVIRVAIILMRDRPVLSLQLTAAQLCTTAVRGTAGVCHWSVPSSPCSMVTQFAVLPQAVAMQMRSFLCSCSRSSHVVQCLIAPIICGCSRWCGHSVRPIAASCAVFCDMLYRTSCRAAFSNAYFRVMSSKRRERSC